MSLINLAKNAGKIFGIRIGRTVPSLGNSLAKYEIKKDEYRFEGENIYFNKLNLTLPKSKAMPVLEAYESATRLMTRPDVKFVKADDGSLLVKIGELQFRINDQEELFILCEVFLEGSYNLISPTSKKIAVIDIGMNVGITSLFYASQSQVNQVFSFEPFTPTFNMAMENIRLNPGVAAKMHPNNFGLAKEKGSMQISYSVKQKGRMGLSGVPEQSTFITDKDVRMETIALEPVKEQFAAIKEKTADHFVICKMDCEGAEYELIDSLFENSLLSLPDVYLIEWHEKPTDGIVDKLIKNNYNVLSTSFRSLINGMIYAMKN